MAGNVAEWVSDWWDPNYYRYSPKDNPKGPRPLDHKIIRGVAGTIQPVLFGHQTAPVSGPTSGVMDSVSAVSQIGG